MAQVVQEITEQSREVLLQNEVSQYLRSLAVPRLDVTRDTDNSDLLVQTGVTDVAQSCYAHLLSNEFTPNTSCDGISKRSLTRWKVILEWDRQVVTDRLIEKVGRDGIQITDGWLRLTDVESPFRPKADPQKGTVLIFTFETLVR